MGEERPSRAGRRALLRAAAAGLLTAPVGACAYFDPPGTWERNQAGLPPGSIPIHILTGDWHADIVIATGLVPPALLEEFMPPPLRRDGHVAFGFGSRGIFQNSRPDVGSFFAAFLNTPGAVAVSRVPPDLRQAEYFEHVVELWLTPGTFAALLRTLRNEIRRDAAGRPLRVGDTVFRRGRVLFESDRRYHAEYTCSTWVAEVLAMAGLPFQVEGVIWPRQVIRQARHIAQARQQQRGLVTG